MRSINARPFAVAVTALSCTVLAATGCGGSKAPKSAPASKNTAAAAGPTITIKNFKYLPASLTVSPGTKVRVVNNDTEPHTVTASGPKGFDTGTIQGGKTGAFTAPSTPGSYPYICSIHPFMHGTLLVR